MYLGFIDTYVLHAQMSQHHIISFVSACLFALHAPRRKIHAQHPETKQRHHYPTSPAPPARPTYYFYRCPLHGV